MNKLIDQLFNEYNRKARIFPALLCSLPFLLIKHFAVDGYFSVSLTTALIGDISLAVVLIYLLSQINRFISKTLFEDKSKFPTTKMLLPSTMLLSADYKKKIEEKIQRDFQLSLPDLKEELANPENTKNRVREIVSLIINQVREGNLVLQHNIEYGFVRNLIGGSVVAFLASVTASLIFNYVLKNETAFMLSVILSLAYLIPIVFSKIILNHFSKEYAHILFREYLGLS